MTNKLPKLIFASILGFCVAFPTIALAADYTIEIPAGTQDPVLELTVDVSGQNKPLIQISALPGENATPYVEYKLMIDNSLKQQWTNPIEVINYNWPVCEAGTSPGTHTVVLNAKDSLSVTTQLAVKSVYIAGLSAASCADSSNQATIAITPSITIPDSPKIITFTLSATGITTADLCSKYTVWLTVGDVSSSNQKGAFCKPSAPNLVSVKWNTLGSTPGKTYSVKAQALGQNNSGNIESTALSYTIQSDGTPKLGTSNGGGGGSNGGGVLLPLKFGVPDLSRLQGKSGLELRIELLNVIIDYLIVVVSMFAIIAFLYSGIMYGTSFGDPAKAEKAKKNLLWAVFGVVIVLLSVVILNIASQLIHSLV